jgi:hypothetical protein
MDAADTITIALPARDWNVVIEVLHGAPYRVAAPLINAIAGQARAAEMAAGRPPAPIPAPERANGQVPAEDAASG